MCVDGCIAKTPSVLGIIYFMVYLERKFAIYHFMPILGAIFN